jgi:NAD(P)-dependent dehydrogenase (short-subunit alcohol dehydrogenase family)
MTNKTLFITGGTSGMAKATVLQATQAGYNVAFMARRAEEGQAVVEEAKASANANHTNEVRYYQWDVTDFVRLEEIINQVRSDFWPITHLFCCAGTHIPGDILSTTLEQRNDLWMLNVTHMFMTMKFILPMMIEAKQGSVVLMWSDQTFIAKRKSSIYGATKAAIWQLTKSTALDYAEYNIRVNAICPGTIETPQALMNAQKLADLSFDWNVEAAKHELSKGQMIERRGIPDEIANVVLFLLSDQASFMTGSLVTADGGYTSS